MAVKLQVFWASYSGSTRIFGGPIPLLIYCGQTSEAAL